MTSASQLHALVSPLWELWAETRPVGLFRHDNLDPWFREIQEKDGKKAMDYQILTTDASALCVARMVQVLRDESVITDQCRYPARPFLKDALSSNSFLLEALVEACHKYLDRVME